MPADENFELQGEDDNYDVEGHGEDDNYDVEGHGEDDNYELSKDEKKDDDVQGHMLDEEFARGAADEEYQQL